MKAPRLATVDDMPRVLEFIRELAQFEKEEEAVEITLNQLENDGFGMHQMFVCYVVEVDHVIQGMALFYPRYSTWKGKVIHLEDLIVNKTYRGQGLGTLLLDAVVKYANSKGVKRISWEVLDWNTKAIDFYNKKGAKILEDWRVVQLDEKGIQNYIEQL